jgi:tripartite motif-containing protein 71
VFVRSIGSRGEGPGQFFSPWEVAVGGGGEIIVCDNVKKNVQVFGREGELLQIIGAGGDSDVAFDEPRCVATDGEGRLFVTDTSNMCVKMLS